jgi:ABC-type branched-subunit amino acid transport system permease subunit
MPLLGSVLGTISASLVGPVIGTYVVSIGLESLRIASSLKIVIFAITLTIVVLARPKGIFHYLEQYYHYFRRVYER